MNVGGFRFRITITQPAQSFDNVGQASYDQSDSFTVWASARSIRGKLTDAGVQEMAGRRYYEFKVRHDDRIDYGCNITFKGQTYRPERIDRTDERNRYMVIYAFESDL